MVVSVRYAEDILAVWNGEAGDEEQKERLKERIKEVLCLPPGTILEYKAHDTAMKDNSSYRNTDKSRA